MSEPKFSPGDVVFLKSGGPNMTVKNYEDNHEVVCSWFKDQDLKEKAFPDSMLKKYEPADFAPIVIPRSNKHHW